MTRDDAFIAILFLMGYFAFPVTVSKKPGFNLLQRAGKLCLKQYVCDLSDRLLCSPAVHLFGAGIPENDATLKIANQHRSKIQSSCLLFECFLCSTALGDISEDDSEKLPPF